MSRWRSLLSRHLQWSSAATQALTLTAVTFCVLLPLIGHRLLYSYYFLRPLYLNTMSEDALRESLRLGGDALRHWQSAAPASPSFAQVAPRPELLVTVVTTGRKEGRDFHYLLQLMRQLSAAAVAGAAACGGRRCAEVLLCDVEPDARDNPDARLLEKHFRVVRRPPLREDDSGPSEPLNIFEREKRDYVFCLRASWALATPRHLLVLEDDALPRPDFFPVVRQLLSRRFARRTLYIKLYHPERLQRYWNPEPYRLLEWVGLGAVGGMLVLLVLPRCGPCSLAFTLSPGHLLFFTLYLMAAAELLGRHYLLELRRLSPQLYAVSPATECCTPAMLFPGNASLRAARYLEAAACAKGNAKDLVLYRLARSVPGESAHSVEPNLVTHIGAFSSVRPNPARPKLL